MHRRTACKMLFAAAVLPIAASCRAKAPTPAEAPDGKFYLCEGCEAVAEREAATLDWEAEIAPPGEPGERLVLSGTVFQSDRRTPAAGIVIYAHHTNANGLYANGSDESVWSRRHGRLRSWVRTGSDGRYLFRTIKPGIYPDRSDPAHIHLFLMEPGRRPYWIDDVVFEGGFGVDERYRRSRENRGGPGIVRLSSAADASLIARRDIVLEQHP